MIGAPSSSASYSSSYSSSSSSSSSATVNHVFPRSTAEAIAIRSKIEKPTIRNMNDPDFRTWIVRVFLCDDVHLNTAKTDLIKNVQKRGTEQQLNELLGRIREAGLRPFFPVTEMGTVDSAYYDQETDKLVWLVHPAGGDHTEFEAHIYQFDGDSQKWLPRDDAKERKYPAKETA